MARGNYEILDFNSDGNPILPDHFDEPDACPVEDGGWREHGGMVQRVNLQYERATEIETIIEEALAAGMGEMEAEDVREVLEGEHDDDIYYLDKDINEDNNGGPRNAHWASKLTYCRRQCFYDWFNLPQSEPLTPYQDAIYTFGSAAGVMIATWFAKAGIYVDRERYMRQWVDGLDYPITGKADVIIKDPTTDDDIEVPVEAKSCSQGTYDTFSSGRGYKYWGTEEVPMKGNVLQLMSYIVDNNGGLENVTEDDYGYLVYVTKNDHNFVVYRVYFNQQLFNNAIYYSRYLEWYVENDTVPPRHPNAGLDLYVNNTEHGNPGEIKDGRFPCLWKSGRGRCDHLRRCFADKLADKGTPEMQEEVQQYLGEDITGEDDDE